MDALAATMVELNEPRPYTDRYPISEAKFEELKEAAHKKKIDKGDATLAKDKGNKVELAGGAMAAFAPAGGPVAAAPIAATNFAGITATGWLPPDCTMATGPSHVVLSVNSSIAIFNKAGGAALLQRTLTVWFRRLLCRGRGWLNGRWLL